MITREKLHENVNVVKSETKDALTLVWNELNNGQQKKIIKNAEVKALLVRYGVIEGDTDAD